MGLSCRVVTRFAPSPTGFLHAGHAFAARLAWTRARDAGGRFLLRIEDIDPARCRPAFDAAIQDDLRRLALHWDGPVLRQSGRLALYAAALAELASRGLVYPCFCSRAEIAREAVHAASAPHGPDGSLVYPGTCRGLSEAQRAARIAAGAPHLLRLDMASAMAGLPCLTFREAARGMIEAQPATFGDVVLARRDMPASYHLCVCLDDAAQGVTLVTRGEDLLAATHLHRLLQHLMGWPTPEYEHFPLLLGPDGRRLSKRDAAPRIS